MPCLLCRVIIQRFFILTALSLSRSLSHSPHKIIIMILNFIWARENDDQEEESKCFFSSSLNKIYFCFFFDDVPLRSRLEFFAMREQASGSKVPKIFMITTFRFSRNKSRAWLIAFRVSVSIEVFCRVPIFSMIFLLYLIEI